MANQKGQISDDNVYTVKTTGGKEIRAVQSKAHPGLYELKFYPGGQLPEVWKNHLFTTQNEAKKYIDSYLKAASK